MLMLLKCQVPVDKGNEAIASGKMAEAIGKAIGQAKPQSVYFCLMDGKRTMLMVFDMESANQQMLIGEPLFQLLDAELSVIPCMTPDDLKAGFAALMQAH
jgi:hypothetical protein